MGRFQAGVAFLAWLGRAEAHQSLEVTRESLLEALGMLYEGTQLGGGRLVPTQTKLHGFLQPRSSPNIQPMSVRVHG